MTVRSKWTERGTRMNFPPVPTRRRRLAGTRQAVDDWATVSPDKNWVSLTPRKDHLPLPPGKHTLRVAYTLNGEKGTIRPVSGPVEIEIKEN